MIKDLKQMAEGTEVKGLPLMIKTARKTFTDAEGTTFQEVVFMDASGEMTGHIVLQPTDREQNGDYHTVGEFTPWKSKTNLCITNAVLQDTDERKKEGVKLVVFECFDAATPLNYEQVQEMQAEDWRKLREDEIRGKIRHGLCCSYITSGANPMDSKKLILDITDFIMTGE
jgi:hypothetical protein